MATLRIFAEHIRANVLMRKGVVLFPALLFLMSHWVLVFDASAGSLNVNFGLQGQTPPSVVVPQNPQDKITTDTVKATVQTTTDLQTSTGAAVSAGTGSVGFDSTISDKKKIFNLPIGYSISDRTAIAVTLPLAMVEYTNPLTGETEKNTSIGDVSLTLKQRFGDEKELEYQALLSTKLVTGDKEKGLGTGAYDIGITGKIIKRIDTHRFTGMLGYTKSVTKPTIAEQEISYGDRYAWMAAYDYNVAKLLRIWISAKLSGTIMKETDINGLPQNDKLVTVDFSPEIRYFFSENRAISLGVNIPVSTKYDVLNAESRGVSVNFGIFSLF